MSPGSNWTAKEGSFPIVNASWSVELEKVRHIACHQAFSIDLHGGAMHEVCGGSLRKLVPIIVEEWVLLHYTAVQEPGHCFLSCRHEAVRHIKWARV